jgi:2-methylcitrate dehydratase PrpD
MVELVKKHKIDSGNVCSIEAEVFQLCYDFAGGGHYGTDKVIQTKEQADHSLPYPYDCPENPTVQDQRSGAGPVFDP